MAMLEVRATEFSVFCVRCGIRRSATEVVWCVCVRARARVRLRAPYVMMPVLHSVGVRCDSYHYILKYCLLSCKDWPCPIVSLCKRCICKLYHKTHRRYARMNELLVLLPSFTLF